jgi:hypothetical protein
MSALGQKRAYALQQAMSALLPIATARAIPANGDVCFTPESGHVRRKRLCPLWAKNRHFAPQQNRHLLDHLVSGHLYDQGYRKPKCSRRFEIDPKVEFCRLQYG